MVAVGGLSLKCRWARSRLDCALLLDGCRDVQCLQSHRPERPRQQDVIDKVRAIDLLPTFPQPAGAAAGGRAQGPRRALYEGRVVEADLDTDSQPQATPGSDGFELSFENVPVATVAKVILGDILGIGYTIESARARHDQPRVRPPGAQVGGSVRPRDRIADQRRRADS